MPSLLFAASVLLATSTSNFQNSDRYLDCITVLKADAEIGREIAQQWVHEGGGANAQHCLALADLAAGFPQLAALRFSEITKRIDAGDENDIAQLHQQSAEAWLTAKRLDKAKAEIDHALEIDPASGSFHLTAAAIAEASEDWHRVSQHITTAEKAGAVSSQAYVMRGRARLTLGDPTSAADDVVKALTINPMNVDALILRGDVQQTGVEIEVYYGNE